MSIFYQPFDTPHGLVPFDRITNDMYEPAIDEGIARAQAEIDAIANNPELPTFENTIVVLERSGQMLNRVLGVFYPMLSADADDQLMEISERVTPRLTEHSNSITLNRSLWQRIKAVYASFDRDAHDQEDWMLLDKTYRAFLRSGASLEGANRERYRTLSKRLSECTLKFGQNHLRATNAFEMWLTAADLDGLPESAVDAAAHAASEKGRQGEYLVTLHAPSYQAFMKYSSRRDLREQLYMAYNTQCTSGEYSNMELCREIANTRLELARLMGSATFADYRLQNSMAQTPQAVYDMLEQLREAYQPTMQHELEQLSQFASEVEGKPLDLKPWDYSFYANKERDRLFQVNDEMTRPYFPLNQVIEGVLGLATRLYGLQFTPNPEAPVFRPEVKVYDVTDVHGQWMGALYTDFFPRSTKQSGAWMTAFREQYVDSHGQDVRPLVTLTMNFTRPTDTKPSLLTFSEVRTFLHEFGHGLHCLLSRCRYESTSGTNVYRDFVELPSQFHENFLTEREFLDSFARHYQSGEPIPQQLIDRLIASSQYGAGYACLRQLSFGLLDMAWHTLSEPYEDDIFALEREAMGPVQAFKPIDGCLMSPQFGHLFSGGYAAGYYGYKWAEILDADAFSKFQEDGIFNPETARQWHDCVMSRGSSDMPMALYERFRGRPPRIDALLHRDGIR
jgi:peptidyl-dipeptidase Dcp